MASKVYNMESPRTGREVANQFIIESDNERCFQSYRSVCAVWDKKEKRLTLGEDYNYSNTTSKYFWCFVRDYLPSPYCNMDRKELRGKIASGEIKVLSQREIEQ